MKQRELALLAAPDRQAHIQQFFDNNGPLGGKLGNEFPTLKTYQSDQDYFRRIFKSHHNFAEYGFKTNLTIKLERKLIK